MSRRTFIFAAIERFFSIIQEEKEEFSFRRKAFDLNNVMNDDYQVLRAV